jgi:hypothetical protein
MSWNEYKNSLLIAFLFAASLLIYGCGSMYEVMQADPAPVTTFIPEPKKLEAKAAIFPFDRFWYDKDINWGHYKKIKVMPVDTSHILEDSLWQSMSSQYIFADKEVKEIADYMQKKFIEELKAAKNSGVTVTDIVDNQTLVLHLSLTQLVPSKAVLSAAGTTVGFFVTGASLINVLSSGCVAFEAKVTEGNTDNVVAMFTDRQKDAAAIIDIKAYSYYANAYGTVDRWAKSFAELTETDDLNKVKKPFPFSFISL